MLMNTFSIITQAKPVVPMLVLSSVGRPISPCPASSVPAAQATISETTVLRVTKHSTTAKSDGTIEMNPMFCIKTPPVLYIFTAKIYFL